MIYAADLTASEVRSQYVVPVLHELLLKSGLVGVVGNIETLPHQQSSSQAITGSLFDDITACIKDGPVKNEPGTNTRCYAEVRSEKTSHFASFLFLSRHFCGAIIQSNRSLRRLLQLQTT
jgi:hypothetical protein